MEIEVVRRGGTGELLKPQANKFREQLVAQGLPRYTEMTRLGQGWQVITTTGVAGLVVRPSTLSLATLFNNEAGGGASYIIDRIFAFNLVSTAVVGQAGLWICMHPQITKPTADITAFRGYTGKQGHPGGAILDVDATVLDQGWFPVGVSQNLVNGITPGALLEFLPEGRFIVPPQQAISVQVVSNVVGNTYTVGFGWYEVQLDLV